MGSCNFALPTPVCENYVPPFPSSGYPTRSPITIGERVLEQELPNDSQGFPSRQIHPTAHFFALSLMFYPHSKTFLPRAWNSPSAPGVFCLITSASLIFQKNSIASLRNITTGFKSRQVSTSRDPAFLSGKTKRNLKKYFILFLLQSNWCFCPVQACICTSECTMPHACSAQ
jgi:hypothetical protein